jgi:hypothetical protein
LPQLDEKEQRGTNMLRKQDSKNCYIVSMEEQSMNEYCRNKIIPVGDAYVSPISEAVIINWNNENSEADYFIDIELANSVFVDSKRIKCKLEFCVTGQDNAPKVPILSTTQTYEVVKNENITVEDVLSCIIRDSLKVLVDSYTLSDIAKPTHRPLPDYQLLRQAQEKIEALVNSLYNY